LNIASIYRYPVKSLDGQRLVSVDAVAGQRLAQDRVYAIGDDKTKFDATAPAHRGKAFFMTLMKNPRLAELKATFDPSGSHLTLRRGGDISVAGDLAAEDDRAGIETFFADFLGGEARGAVKIFSAQYHHFTDIRDPDVSIVNLASVQALGTHLGYQVDPLRFRANFYVSGLEPWAERRWPAEQKIMLGPVELTLSKGITRCAAINVDPASAEVGEDLTKVLLQDFEDNKMGVYARIQCGGTIREGDVFQVIV